MNMPAGMPMMQPMQFGSGEGVKISFKNAKITIDRIVFKERINKLKLSEKLFPWFSLSESFYPDNI